MSDLLPLFPLPNVVLFPNVFLPLHIFEPRYREMVTDAVASDRLIGMLLLPAVAGDVRAPKSTPGRSRAGEARIPEAMSDEDLVNALAQYLDLEPLEKQALLEQPCLRSRATSLVELLEMKILMARTPGMSHVAH